MKNKKKKNSIKQQNHINTLFFDKIKQQYFGATAYLIYYDFEYE